MEQLHYAIIWDTSVLMIPDLFEKILTNLLNLNNADGLRGSFILPLQVAQEIKVHLDSNEKAKDAKRARSKIAKLLLPMEGLKRVDLGPITIPELKEPELGPDSEVDKKIIGLALAILSGEKQYCNESRFSRVLVATLDGGIIAEISTRRTQLGEQIYPISSNKDLYQALGEWLLKPGDVVDCTVDQVLEDHPYKTFSLRLPTGKVYKARQQANEPQNWLFAAADEINELLLEKSNDPRRKLKEGTMRRFAINRLSREDGKIMDIDFKPV